MFWLYLVVYCATSHASGLTAPDSEDTIIEQFRVLVVEDSKTSFKIVDRFVKEGFELAVAKTVDIELVVTNAVSCEDALIEVDKALESGSGLDMIVVDQNLTGKMKGTEFARRARSKSLDKDTRPIMILNSDDPVAQKIYEEDKTANDPLFHASTGKKSKELKVALTQTIPAAVERKRSK